MKAVIIVVCFIANSLIVTLVAHTVSMSYALEEALRGRVICDGSFTRVSSIVVGTLSVMVITWIARILIDEIKQEDKQPKERMV